MADREADVEAAAPVGHAVQYVPVEGPEGCNVDDADAGLALGHEVLVEDGEHCGLGLPCGGGADEEDVAALEDLGYEAFLGLRGLIESSLLKESPHWPAEH